MMISSVMRINERVAKGKLVSKTASAKVIGIVTVQISIRFQILNKHTFYFNPTGQMLGSGGANRPTSISKYIGMSGAASRGQLNSKSGNRAGSGFTFGNGARIAAAHLALGASNETA